MKAREGILESSTFGEKTKKLFPIIEHGGSDSTAVDNVMEFIAMDGHRTLPEGMQYGEDACTWRSLVCVSPREGVAVLKYVSGILELRERLGKGVFACM